ncbi:MerR family transcriptional regulator [Enterococcus sp. AZ109]|uniref:MerR family transcriptional regulator n=1 Tax=Enterococcus sp. AZ109 TaxID=2774634 RepID=UPI003F258C77
MKYKINEVSKILNIPIDTLRFYEKKGIISPEKDEKTNYRMFDDWDINYLLEYKKFRKMEFSLSEVKEMIHELDYSEYLDLMKSKQETIQKKIIYYQLYEKKLQYYVNSLENIDLGFQMVTPPSRLFISHRKNFEYIQVNETKKSFSLFMDYYALIDNIVIIRFEDIVGESENFEWGFAVEQSDADGLEIPYETDERIEEIPSQLYLRFIVDAGERWNFSKKLLEPGLEYLKNRKYEVAGDVFGILLARINDKKYMRFIEFFVPIKKL